jgi:putative DNA primase/helicase
VIVRTGSGGRHYWFSRPDVPGRLSHGGHGSPFGIDGLHFRCDGRLVVVPPSRNAQGPYSLLEPYFDELYPPPADLVEMLIVQRKPITTAADGFIHRGARNMTLTSLAGTMRDRGMTEEEITAALLVVNQNRCRPPLPEHEVRGIAASVVRYEPTRPPGRFVEVPVALIADASLGAWEKAVYAALGQ